MSDMSFKQAKELIQRLELSELTLKATLDKMDISSENFNKLVNIQTELKQITVNQSNKIINLKIFIALNIGFIMGLLMTKYFL